MIFNFVYPKGVVFDQNPENTVALRSDAFPSTKSTFPNPNRWCSTCIPGLNGHSIIRFKKCRHYLTQSFGEVWVFCAKACFSPVVGSIFPSMCWSKKIRYDFFVSDHLFLPQIPDQFLSIKRLVCNSQDCPIYTFEFAKEIVSFFSPRDRYIEQPSSFQIFLNPWTFVREINFLSNPTMYTAGNSRPLQHEWSS